MKLTEVMRRLHHTKTSSCCPWHPLFHPKWGNICGKTLKEQCDTSKMLVTLAISKLIFKLVDKIISEYVLDKRGFKSLNAA